MKEYGSESGITNLTATKRLAIRAQEAALDFEKTMVKELELIDPDEMDGMSQRIYLDATKVMGAKVRDAVLDAVKALTALPKKQQDEELPSSSSSSSPPSV